MQENFSAEIGARINEFTAKMKEVDSSIKNAATGAEVDITADIIEFQRKAQQTAAVARALEREGVDIPIRADFDLGQFNNYHNRVRYAYQGTSEEARRMSAEMRSAMYQQSMAMRGVKDDMIGVEYGYFKMAQGAKEYTGTTKEFMAEIEALGKKQKTITDNIMKQNELLKSSIFQTAGTMLNMSTQASKIADNYERMNNPLLKVNAAGLAVADSLNKMANAGNASVLALKQLGPTADMKKLNDMIQMINQGVMRFQMVAMGAAVTSYFFYGALHDAAMANEEYATSFNTMLATIRKALQPMVDAFTTVMIKVYDFISAIGQMVIKFNEAHPTLAKLIQGVMMLVPALTLLLSPLAVGIGLAGGLAAAWNNLWMLIGPLITGLGAMSATVWVVAAAIVGLVAGITYLWNTNEGFRDAVISAWNQIKETAIAVWDFISPYINQAISAVSMFLQEKLAEMKAFWDEHGTQIMQAVQNAWNVIKSIFSAAMAVLGPIVKVGWEVIKAIIVSTWEAIKNVINGALDVIQGIIKVFTGLFTGDFELMWEGIKQVFTGALQAIWGLVNLYFLGKFLGPLKGFASQAKTLIQTAWNFIKGLFTNALNTIKTTVANSFNAIKKNIKDTMKNAQTVIKDAWDTIKSSISKAIGSIVASIKSAFSTIESIIYNTMSAIKSVLNTIWNTIKDLISKAVTSAYSSVKSKFDAIKKAVSTAMDEALSIVKKIGNSIVSFFKGINLYESGKAIIQSAIDGLLAMKDKILGVVEDIVGAVRDYWPFSPAKRGPLSDIHKMDFAGPISTSINKAKHSVSRSMASLAAVARDSFAPQQSIADIGYSSIDTGTQMDELKRQIKQELEVDLWVNQEQKIASSQSNGSSGDLVFEIDGYEFARITRDYFDELNGKHTRIALAQRGIRV